MIDPVRLAVDFISYVLWFAALDLLLRPRFSILLTVLLELVFFVPYYWITNFFGPLSMLRIFLGLALIVGLVLFFLQGKWYARVLSVFLVMLMMILSEFLTAALVPPDLFGDTIHADGVFPLQYYILYLSIQALLLSALVIVGRFLKRREKGKFSTTIPLLFLLFPLSQFLILTVWFFPLRSGGNLPGRTFTAVCVLVCFAADIALAVLFRAVSRSADLKVQNRLLSERLSADKDYEKVLDKSRQEICRMKEDLARCPETIRNLLQTGQTGKAVAFTEELQKQFGRKEGQFSGCGNTVLASFLSHRAEELSREGNTLQADIHLPGSLRIPNPDLICAFGNLLDNAAEACSASSDKHISLRAEYRSPYLSIEMLSPANERSLHKARRIPELERGLGLIILKNMADRYDGEFQAFPDGGIFRTTLILKEEPEHAENSHL